MAKLQLPKPLIPAPCTEFNRFDGLVSVIIATYNCASTLPKSIQSMKDQTYRNIEIIVSDDASTDNTQEVVAGLGVVYIHLSKNSGAAAARNEGARAARGEVLVFTEADGYYDADYIEKILRYMHLPGVAGAINLGREVWTDHNNVLTRLQNDQHEAAVRQVLRGKRGTGAWAFWREAFWKAGGYDAGLRIGQDVDLVRRLEMAGWKTTIGDRSVLHHKDPDNLRAYLKRAYKGTLNSGLFFSRWHGSKSRLGMAAYVMKFTGLVLLPLYLLLTIEWPAAFVPLFFIGIAYLLLEDQATFLGWRIGLERGDIATALATPGLLYLRRLAIGIGRIKTFFSMNVDQAR